MLKAIKFWLIISLCATLANNVRADHESESSTSAYNYHWGRGLTLPSADLNFGGYITSTYSRPENQPDKFGLEDLSLFITWSPLDRLRFFTELSTHNWLSTYENLRFEDTLSFERLFVDYLVSDSTTVRFGKFLTPFGRWNVIHSAPLVWTTNRPVITDDAFFLAWRANGLQVNHTRIINEHNLDLTIYIDDSKHLEPRSINTVSFDKAIGTRLNYELTENLQIGASYLAYQKLADFNLPTHHVFGIDALWQNQGYEVLFESLYHILDLPDPKRSLDEKGLYIQGVAPLGGDVYAVARYEYLNTNRFQNFLNMNTLESHIGIGGLAWRPYAPLMVKAEYRFGDINPLIVQSGFYFSVAMFF